MELGTRHLRMMATVEAEGTLTAAARRLFVTQSALSHQLADLERRVGARLFHRVGKRLVPTPAGRRLLDGAAPILTAIKDLEADLADLASGKAGLLRITTQCQTSYHWMPEVLPRFRASHPGVDLRIVPEASARPIDALLAGEVDLALVYELPEDERIAHVPLFEDDVVLIVGPEHRLATRAVVVAEDLRDEHLLVYVDHPSTSLLHQRVLAPAGVTPERISAVPLTEGIVSLVAAGMGVAAVTRWSVAPDIVAGRVAALRITDPGLRRAWKAAFLAGEGKPPYLDAFLALIAAGPARLFAAPAARRVRAATGITVA